MDIALIQIIPVVRSRLYLTLLSKISSKFLSRDESDQIVRLGSNYGGWNLCECVDHLQEEGVYIGVGVGEDISFDTEILNRTKMSAVLLDPTQRAKQHVTRYLSRTDERHSRAYSLGGKQEPLNYLFRTDFQERVRFINKALWIDDGGILLNKPKNASHVSYQHESIRNDKDVESERFESVSLIQVRETIIANFGYHDAAIVKLDIEGCEVEIVKQNSCNWLNTHQLLIEFDFLRSKTSLKNVYKYLSLMRKLKGINLRLAHIEGLNYLFLREVKKY